jgi:hypothetical protein
VEKLLARLKPLGRSGASLFALACAERLRPLLEHVPSGAPPLVAGLALTQLWRVVEGAERPDPRTLRDLSEKCWVLVEIEPAGKVEAVQLERLVAAAHHTLETYLSGNPEQAVAAAGKIREALPGEEERQERDLAELEKAHDRGQPLAQLATKLRQRSEKEGAKLVAALLSRNA